MSLEREDVRSPAASQTFAVPSALPDRQALAVGRPGHGIDLAPVPLEDEEFPAVVGVPDPRRPVRIPRARESPFGDQATELTRPACPLIVSSSRPPAASQTLTVPSQLPVASRLPSGDQDTELTQPGWPLRQCRSRPSAAPTPAVPSVLPVASDLPSGDQATQTTWPACPLKVEALAAVGRVPDLGRPVLGSPWPAVLPSGDQATDQTRLPCPSSVSSSRPSAACQTFAVPSQLAVASRFAVGRPGHGIDLARMPLECEELAAGRGVPDPRRHVPAPGRQPTPVRRPGQRPDAGAVADQGVPLQVAEPLPVVPLEAPVGIRLGRDQQLAQAADLAGVPGRLHQVDGGGIPLPTHLLLRRAGPAGLVFRLVLGRLGHRPRGGLAHITDRRDPGHRRQQDEDRRQQPRHRLVPQGPPPGPLRRRRPPRPDRPPLQEPPQVVAQVGRRAITPRRLLAQALQADRLQVARQARPQRPGRDRLGFEDQAEGLGLGLAPERRPAGQDLVERGPQRVDVGRRADIAVAAGGLLGGHVVRRAHPRPARVSSPASSSTLARPKSVSRGMKSLGPGRRGEDDVVGLDVAVEDAAVVGVLGGVGQRGGPGRGRAVRHGRVLGLEPLAEAGPGAELGGDEVAERPELAGVEDADDVGMVEPGGGLGLAEEAADVVGAEHALGQGHLEGDLAAQEPVAAADDEAEAARAEVLEDLEAAQQGGALVGSVGGPVGRFGGRRPVGASAASSIRSRSRSRLRARSSASTVERKPPRSRSRVAGSVCRIAS